MNLPSWLIFVLAYPLLSMIVAALAVAVIGSLLVWWFK